MTIKLKDIASAPWNPRADITPESVAELAADIEANGLIQPITIWLKGELPNRIEARYCIAGNRRLAALRVAFGDKADLKNEWYKFFGGTEDEARAITFRENHHRVNLTPIGEAAQIAQFVADGMTIRDAALALGISEAKARRRSRLTALSDAWKSRDDLTVDILEKIAAYPTDIQERVAKTVWSGMRTWRDLSPRFDAATKDLDAAKFDTKQCVACLKRTGAEADLFGVADEKLGRCLCDECFSEKREEWEQKAVEKATKGAAEIVRCEGRWDMPDDDETSERRTKEHPCAYVCIDGDGAVEVLWGESKKAREERELAEQQEREAEAAADRERRERIDAIVAKLKEYAYESDDHRDEIEAFVDSAISKGDENAVAHAVEHAVADVCGWQSASGYAHLLRIYPELATNAGVSDADREYLLGEYPETDDAEDEEENE